MEIETIVLPRPRNEEIITPGLCLTISVSLSALKLAYFRSIRMPMVSVTRGIAITPMSKSIISRKPKLKRMAMMMLPRAVIGVIRSMEARILVMMTLSPLIGIDFNRLKALPSREIVVVVIKVMRLVKVTRAKVTLGRNERISSAVRGNSSLIREATKSSYLKHSAPIAITKITRPTAVLVSRTGVLKYLTISFLTMARVWLSRVNLKLRLVLSLRLTTLILVTIWK